MSTPVDHLKRAVTIAGSQTELAKLMTDAGYHVTQQAVSVWIKNGKFPSDAVPYICAAVGQQVKASDLCPQLFAVA